MTEELRRKQLEFELEHDVAAAAQRLQELRSSAASGDTDAPRAVRLMARLHSIVCSELRQLQEARVHGSNAKYLQWLRALPVDVAAAIAIRECIHHCTSSTHTSQVRVQDLASNIGKLWELEVRINEAELVNPLYMQRIHDQVQDRCTRNQNHLRRTYNVAYERVMKGEIDSHLNRFELVQIGKFGIQACMDAGLIEAQHGLGKGGCTFTYFLTEEVASYLHGYTDMDVARIVDKTAGAMMCPPDDWTTLADGGYLSPRRKFAYPLMDVQTLRHSARKEVLQQFTAENMPIVFETANYLQSQTFQVHEPTFRAIQDVWAQGGGAMGVPKKSAPEKPKFPFPPEWDSANATADEALQFGAWKRDCVMHYEYLKEWRGKVRELGGFLKVVRVHDNGPLWFPVFCDKRNRWYYAGTPNPQGSDIARSVLHFHEKKPLGNEGLFWLKVSIANHAGFDKERFADRARWTEQHWPAIERALDSPADYPDVWGKDAPWCMFSAAWELREALRSPVPALYKTGIPVHMDATCSGLQHFAAILRDPVGGRYVNLFDEAGCGPKQDIYARVAQMALEAIKRDSEGDDPRLRQIASWWLNTGIPRGLAKKPVMTYVYGATLLGTTHHVIDYVQDEMKLSFPEGVKPFEYAQYCGRKLFTGIAMTVPAAANAMQWLKEIAKQQPRGKRMTWKTPTGFIVQHDYQSYEEKRVKLRSCGIIQTVVRNYTDSTEPTQMQNAIAPNFVHALDAAHLSFTAIRMKRDGLNFVGIHDSFGTHPCDVKVLHSHIREAFIELYQHRNVLGEFLWDVGAVGEAPMRGTLDLEGVRNSEFFFC